MNSNGNANVGNVDSNGNVNNDNVNNGNGVRPVVSLANGTLVSSIGDGTSTNPYVVE